MFKLFFRRRQRFITNMWNSFWWWRDRFNSEVQLKDRIGWEGNIKNSLLNCQWRSVSHVWLVTEFNWVVMCCRSWVGFYRFILLTPIFGRNTRKIIHLNNYNFMWKHAFGMASFQCLAKKDCSKVLWNTWFNLCEAVHHQKYWEWIFVILSATRLPTCPRNMWPLFKLLVTSSVLIVEDNLNLSSNLSKGKRSFKPYQNEYDSLIRYLTKCVARENIQTPTTEGISLRTPTSLGSPFLMGTDTPPAPPEFPQVWQTPQTLWKSSFSQKKTIIVEEWDHLWLVRNGFHQKLVCFCSHLFEWSHNIKTYYTTTK